MKTTIRFHPQPCISPQEGSSPCTIVQGGFPYFHCISELYILCVQIVAMASAFTYSHAKFWTPCSIVLHSQETPPQLPKYPGGILRSYHILLNDSIDAPRLRTYPNKWTVQMEKGTGKSGVGIDLFAKKPLDWEEETLVYITNNIHDGMYAIYGYYGQKKRRMWGRPHMATIKTLADRINASIYPRIWDKTTAKVLPEKRLTGPLQLGDGHICLLFNPAKISAWSLTSEVIDFDHVVFISWRARVGSSPGIVTALFSPLSWATWAALALTFLTINLYGFIILKSEGYYALSPEVVLKLVLVVCGLFLEQPFSRAFKAQRRLLFVFSITIFLVSAVICGLYKSRLVSAFVRPNMEVPPRRLEDLAEREEFRVFGSYYSTSLEAEFNHLKSLGWVKKLRGRIYNSEDIHGCVYSVIEWGTVCLGYRNHFITVAVAHFPYTQRKWQLQLSQPVLGTPRTFGVSKHFPELLEPLNTIIRYFVPSGLYLKWRDYESWQSQEYGKRMRRERINGSNQVRLIARYGVQPKDEKRPWELYYYLVWIEGLSVALVFLCFLCEICYSVFRNCLLQNFHRGN